jgi:hypothetical protein
MLRRFLLLFFLCASAVLLQSTPCSANDGRSMADCDHDKGCRESTNDRSYGFECVIRQDFFLDIIIGHTYCAKGYSQDTECDNSDSFSGMLNDVPECSKCDGGRYRSSYATKSCSDCPVGKDHRTSRTGCDTCSSGKYNPKGRNGYCSNCDAGRYSSSGAGSCSYCPTGKAQSSTGESSCGTCSGNGYYASSTGQSSCSR